MRLFGEGRLTLLARPLLAAATCCCTAFTQGGSAEEFALPALAVGVYLTLAAMTRAEEKTRGRMLGFGAAAGWVFLIKYTDIGLFAGLACACWRLFGGGRGSAARCLPAGRCCWARRWSARRGGVSGGQRCAGCVRRDCFVQNLIVTAACR